MQSFERADIPRVTAAEIQGVRRVATRRGTRHSSAIVVGELGVDRLGDLQRGVKLRTKDVARMPKLLERTPELREALGR